MPPTDPMTPQRLREIAQRLDDRGEGFDVSNAADDRKMLLDHAEQLERNGEWQQCPVTANDLRANSGLIAGMLLVLKDKGQHFTDKDLKRTREAMEELDALANWIENRTIGGWRDINTAPKDNALKLLVLVDGELGIWYRDAYYAEGGRGHETGMSGWVDQEGIGRYDSPTHWMPLPKPPENA